MKTICLCALLLCLVFATSNAYANSCETLLCMAGKLQGQSGGSACDQPISAYFSIIKFGKRGKFNPASTAAARLNFLNSCSSPGIGDWPTRINAVYGTII